MAMIHTLVSYRPLRIGWCVRDDSVEDIVRAMRVSACLWGGIYDPILPVDLDYVANLVRLFRVDALHPVHTDPRLSAFEDRFEYLPWPFLHRELFVQGATGREAQLLDVHHVVLELAEVRLRNLLPPARHPVIVSWDADDPIANGLLANFGAFPPVAEIGIDYVGLLTRRLEAAAIPIDTTGQVPRRLVQATTPLKLTGHELRGYGPVAYRPAGFFVGASNEPSDLVAFWNLRAAGLPLFFVDLEHIERFSEVIHEVLQLMRSRPANSPWTNEVAIWSRQPLDDAVYRHFGDVGVVRHVLSEHTWNGLNVIPAEYRSEGHSSVGAISEEYGEEVATFPLLNKPFAEAPELDSQQLVVTLGNGRLMEHGTRRTYCPPFVPQLNEFYGRTLYFEWNKARSEPEAIGIVSDLRDTHVALIAIDHDAIVGRLFGLVNTQATPSESGRVCNQVIDQMGGLRGCRVFRITGVRDLFRQFDPDQPFAKRTATNTIRDIDPDTRQSRLTRFENIHLVPHQSESLKPNDVFDHLVLRKVLRAGLRPKCAKCQLRFWVPLDRIATEVTCELCGARFDLTPQLKMLSWEYQRSGVFGKRHDDRGPIPVALVLHQLQEFLHFNPFVFSTGIDLRRPTDPTSCEVDVVAITGHPREGTSVILGECKTAGEIDERDIRNLVAVADDLASLHVNTYILLAKTERFSSDEIERAKLARERYRERVILLSRDELEGEDLVGNTNDLPERLRRAHGLSELAHVTTHRYFGGQYPGLDFLDGHGDERAAPRA